MTILNDKEHRIFLSAMRREYEICKKIDEENPPLYVGEDAHKLTKICSSIERKVDEAVFAVHGNWTCDHIEILELSYGGYAYIPHLKCSSCGRISESYARYDEPVMPDDMDGWDYCPNCGAKMDDGVDE